MWQYRARVERQYDGDSFWAVIDQGFDDWTRKELRLFGVYAPELAQPGGAETREFVAEWFGACNPSLQWPLYVQTIQTKTREPGEKMTFTRYLAVVWRYGEQVQGVSLNEAIERFLDRHPEWPGGVGA